MVAFWIGLVDKANRTRSCIRCGVSDEEVRPSGVPPVAPTSVQGGSVTSVLSSIHSVVSLRYCNKEISHGEKIYITEAAKALYVFLNSCFIHFPAPHWMSSKMMLWRCYQPDWEIPLGGSLRRGRCLG